MIRFLLGSNRGIDVKWEIVRLTTHSVTRKSRYGTIRISIELERRGFGSGYK